MTDGGRGHATGVIVLIDGRIAADASPRALLGEEQNPAVRALIDVSRRQAARLSELEGDR